MVIGGETPVPDLPGMTGRIIARASPERFKSPQLLHLFKWWQEIANDHPPHLAEFDILQHSRLAPHVFLIATHEQGYALRLAGEDYLAMVNLKKGHEWRRDAADILERDFANYLDFVTRQAVPYFSTGRLALSEIDWLSFESLLCPVLEDSSQKMMLLGVAVRLPA